MNARETLIDLLNDAARKRSATVYWPPEKPRIRVTVTASDGNYSFAVASPTSDQTVTHYSLHGVLYLMETAYSPTR